MTGKSNSLHFSFLRSPEILIHELRETKIIIFLYVGGQLRLFPLVYKFPFSFF